MRLTLRADGSIEFFSHDIGPGVEEAFGRDEYECGATVPPSAVGRLAFALLRDKFAGRLNAVHEFRDFCKERGIGCGGWAY